MASALDQRGCHKGYGAVNHVSLACRGTQREQANVMQAVGVRFLEELRVWSRDIE